ncbi:hypothetical protein J6590_040798 [Homalodisca vitripennis]|nr:hypothetical protein J6590_040798 [Homalodisca vitripennis]
MHQNDLKELYNGKLPIKLPKFKDLLHLKQFLTLANSQAFHDSLAPVLEVDEGEEDAVEYADDPPIDEAHLERHLRTKVPFDNFPATFSNCLPQVHAIVQYHPQQLSRIRDIHFRVTNEQ